MRKWTRKKGGFVFYIREEKADETVAPPTPVRGMLCLSLVFRFAFVYTRVISDRFPDPSS